MIGIVVLFSESGFQTTNWQRYLYLAGIFIFVDLALFLTPTIKKFGGAEMETVQEIESINKQMQKEIKKIQSKSAVYTNILSRLQSDQLLKKEWTDIEEYRTDLEIFLNYYGEACMQEIIVFYDSVEETLPVQLRTVLGIELNKEQENMLENEQIVEVQQ
ncbi:type II toxin-antitoxin system SpoIISA family toxin [Metabacillus sp. Hm71]|uniref:type II toxin-antitoxin system SpoIISA family toxin n=1 Tax=Metabacillus sp. Hm71 TaxID=3450743 RepID=UPI003F43FCA6